jgi:hypothetical protein
MKSISNPAKLLAIWESYWGKLSDNWTENFLTDARIDLIIKFEDLLILQAVQENKKLVDILGALEKNSRKLKTEEASNKIGFSRINIGQQTSLGTELEVNEIKEWLREFSREKLSPDEVVTWLSVKTDIETCRAKVRYPSEKEAILAIIRLGKKNREIIKQLPYKCNVCRQFHNSHLLSREAIEKLQLKYS